MVKKESTFEEDEFATDQRSPLGPMMSPSYPITENVQIYKWKSFAATQTSTSGHRVVAAVTEDQNNPARRAGRHNNISGFSV